MAIEKIKKFGCDCCGATAEVPDGIHSPNRWIQLKAQTYGDMRDAIHKDIWLCSRNCVANSLDKIAAEFRKKRRP